MNRKAIKWTEKIQAFAAIIAILGGFAGFYKLFSTDKEMQRQIENLAKIANDISEQTNIMRAELKNSTMRNNLIIEQLAIDKEKWIIQNKPDFSIDLSRWDEWSGENDSTSIEGFSLINKGGSAYLLDLSYNKDNTCVISVPKTYIANQGKTRFKLTFSIQKEFCIDINLIYQDIAGNMYSQRLNSDKFDSNDFANRELGSFDFLNIKSGNPIKINDNYRP